MCSLLSSSCESSGGQGLFFQSTVDGVSRRKLHHSNPLAGLVNQSENNNYPLFENLPTNLYYIVRGFLKSSDFLSILHTSKQFKKVKYETMFYSLNAQFSEMYLTNQVFRERMIQSIRNPSIQVSLQVNSFANIGKCPETFLPQKLQMTLILSSCLSNVTLTRNPQHFRRNQETLGSFTFSQLTETDTSSRRLLFNGYDVTHDDEKKLIFKESKYDIMLRLPTYGYYFDSFFIGFNDAMSDFNPFRFTQTLILQQCPALTDVTPLAMINHLELIECNNVTDVVPLSHVHHLSLSGCEGVRDLSSLLYNSTLIIENCNNVKDFSWLCKSHIRHLKLQHAQNDLPLILPQSMQEVELSNFQGNVLTTSSLMKKLTLRACSLSTIPPFFESLHFIHLFNCPIRETDEKLGQIHTVIIEQCSDLISLRGLGQNNNIVEIRNCSNVVDFSPLKTVPIVKILSCRRFKRWEEVEGVVSLTVHDTFAVDVVHSLKAVKELTLSQCYRLSRIECLGSESSQLESLTIADCDEFQPAENINELRKWNKITVQVAGNLVQQVFDQYDECLTPSGYHKCVGRGENQCIYLH